MAYQTGSVNSLADIQNVIQTFLTANGWTWDSANSTIYKNNLYVKFIAPSGDKVLFRAMTALTGGTSPIRDVGMGRMAHTDNATFMSAVITYPATYFLFLDSDEFYCIINYNVTMYQFVTWGQSTVDVGAEATGMFISGSVNSVATYSGAGAGANIGLTATTGGYNSWWAQRSAAPFWTTNLDTTGGYDQTNDFVHTTIDGATWNLHNSGGSNTLFVGAGANGNIIQYLPNVWNGESPFLPVRIYKMRPESKSSLVAELKNARYCRIDNFNDQETVSIGSNEWMVFPFFRRDMLNRNGATSYANHTGTFGWAIRKIL